MDTSPGGLWRCMVCGHVHRGGSPPAACPVCGVGPEQFEAVGAPAARPAAGAVRWRCDVCGYEHGGREPPETCPVCGVGRECFKAVRAPGAPAGGPRVVIVGAGIAGVSAAEAALLRPGGARVTLLGAEDGLPYRRAALAALLSGEADEADLALHPADWYARDGLRHLAGARAEAVDRERRVVRLAGGEELPYDALVLACGAQAALPPIAGAALPGVCVLRTLADARAVLAAAAGGGPAAVVGGGLLGLEIAGALRRRGCAVSVLEGLDRLLPRQLSVPAAAWLRSAVEARGVAVRTGVKVEAVTGAERAAGVRLGGGEVVPAAFVVVAAGMRPDCALARRAGLQVGRGVIVGGDMRTSDPRILAAGDAAELDGALCGLWAPAGAQGRVAGANAAGGAETFKAAPPAATLRVLGLDVTSAGSCEDPGPDAQVVAGEHEGAYYRFALRAGRIVGLNMVGRVAPGLRTAAALAGKDYSGLLPRSPGIRDVLAALRHY